MNEIFIIYHETFNVSMGRGNLVYFGVTELFWNFTSFLVRSFQVTTRSFHKIVSSFQATVRSFHNMIISFDLNAMQVIVEQVIICVHANNIQRRNKTSLCITISTQNVPFFLRFLAELREVVK